MSKKYRFEALTLLYHKHFWLDTSENLVESEWTRERWSEYNENHLLPEIIAFHIQTKSMFIDIVKDRVL